VPPAGRMPAVSPPSFLKMQLPFLFLPTGFWRRLLPAVLWRRATGRAGHHEGDGQRGRTGGGAAISADPL